MAACIFMPCTVRRNAQTVILWTLCCTVGNCMQPDSGSCWQMSARRWRLDCVWHCWQTWDQGRSEGRPIPEDAGLWVSTSGCAFSCGGVCVCMCACVIWSGCFFCLHKALTGRKRRRERQKLRELAVKVSNYTKRRCVPRRDSTLWLLLWRRETVM